MTNINNPLSDLPQNPPTLSGREDSSNPIFHLFSDQLARHTSHSVTTAVSALFLKIDKYFEELKSCCISLAQPAHDNNKKILELYSEIVDRENKYKSGFVTRSKLIGSTDQGGILSQLREKLHSIEQAPISSCK